MKIIGKTQDWEMKFCDNFFSRLKGNMGKKEINHVLVFPHCNSIHTFFMRTKIDVLMVSKENVVLYVFPKVAPFRILWPRKGVSKVLEWKEGENIYQVGDKVMIQKEN